ncbi:MAG: hypothetical protein J6M60_05320 [Clostridia bacterium]|nr:hypothetical protein [Clostridia bacterium]
MAEEPNDNKEKMKSSTDINDLVEEVERLLREVEEKEKIENEKDGNRDDDIAGEIKAILEKPDKKQRKRKEETQKVDIKNEIKVEEEVKQRIETQKRGRGRPKKITYIQEEKTEENIYEKKEEKILIEKPIIEKKTDSSELITIKGETKEITISRKQLEKIENEIRKQKDIPKQDRDIINKKIFKNIFIGILIVLYFISLNLGFLKLKEETFLNDIRVFSGILIATTIFIFEKAYRKESIEFTVMGIEFLVLSIVTLLTNYIYTEFYTRFPYIINTVSMFFAIYYVGKSIISYIKMRKAVLKKISDIRNIINRSK